MKTIIASAILNLLLVSGFLLFLDIFVETKNYIFLILYLLLSVFLPIIGIVMNTIFQKDIEIILSNIYVSFLSAFVLMLPIELFKKTDKIINAEKLLNGKSIDGSNSAITFDIDLSFNLSNYIIIALFWVLIGSLLGAIAKRIKKS
ncbi:TPA: hypothetical protein R1932_001362 [Staphylococcus delphini]|nr:hypothetical protein [Staphylococcus delphini]